MTPLTSEWVGKAEADLATARNSSKSMYVRREHTT
jgi:hypothetical protein